MHPFLKSVDTGYKLLGSISPINYDIKYDYVSMDNMIGHIYNKLQYTFKQIIFFSHRKHTIR